MKLAQPTDRARRPVAIDALDREFKPVLATPAPADDAELADLIEQDGRWRLDRGLPCGLDRYYGAVPDLTGKPIALDAAIDISLRSLALRDGCTTPEERHAESLLRSYPYLAGPIRLAALLNNQLIATTGPPSERRRRPMVPLPCSIGPTLEDGRRRYELLRPLGRGSSGTVCEAVDQLLSDSSHAAKVAVKLIPVDPATVQRQAAEATKARRIEHPGVVRVLDRGLTEHNELYLVYELVTGGDLQAWFDNRGKAIEPREAAEIVGAIASGVQAAHSAGLVHCDLKPSNVLMTPEGEPRVSDFGVAAMAEHGSAGEGDRQLPVGNLAFAAPEQVRRSGARVSPLVDVYALGGLLYYLTTGALPNGATLDEVSRTHDPAAGRKVAPSIRDTRPKADSRLDRLCARALAPRPEDRYPTAGELASDLGAWLDKRPIRWLEESAPRRVALWVRRSPGMAALSAACAAVLISGAFVSGYFADRSARWNATAKTTRDGLKEFYQQHWDLKGQPLVPAEDTLKDFETLEKQNPEFLGAPGSPAGAKSPGQRTK